jgi:hypothetical protein
VDSALDPLLLRKFGSSRTRTQNLCDSSQELCPLDHRGSPRIPTPDTNNQMVDDPCNKSLLEDRDRWTNNFPWKIWGFHGGDYEERCLLGCYAVWRRNNPEDTFLQFPLGLSSGWCNELLLFFYQNKLYQWLILYTFNLPCVHHSHLWNTVFVAT